MDLILRQVLLRIARGYAATPELRGHAEDGVDELALRYSIALSDPADLTFADCVHRLAYHV